MGSESWRYACAQAGIGRCRGASLDLEGKGRQGPEGSTADGEEAGEAPQDVVVGGCRQAAAWAVQGRDVEAALVREEEATAPIQAAGLGPAGLEAREGSDQRGGVRGEVPVDRGDLARVLAKIRRGLQQACDDVEALQRRLRRGRGPPSAGADIPQARARAASASRRRFRPAVAARSTRRRSNPARCRGRRPAASGRPRRSRPRSPASSDRRSRATARRARGRWRSSPGSRPTARAPGSPGRRDGRRAARARMPSVPRGSLP